VVEKEIMRVDFGSEVGKLPSSHRRSTPIKKLAIALEKDDFIKAKSRFWNFFSFFFLTLLTMFDLRICRQN
jgi:hypothetical protein